MVIWVIGMSASGKTVIGSEMLRLLRASKGQGPWVFLDGDEVREMMGSDLGHSLPDRKKNAERISRMCAFLENQGVHVLACVLSIFHESQDWNRKNLKDYRQLYLRADLETLKRRDTKRLYERAQRGEISDVVGVDILFPEPKNNDFVLDNQEGGVPVVELARQALQGLGINLGDGYPYTQTDLLNHPFKYEYTPFEGEPLLVGYRQSREKAVLELKSKMELFAKSTLGEKETGNDPKFERLADYLLLPLREELGEHFGEWKSRVAREILPLDYRKRFFQQVDSKTGVITREFLVRELGALADGQWEWEKSDESILTLIQRFEVGKKIYTRYLWDSWKKIDGDFSDLLNFPLFQILLASASERVDPKNSLILQNSLLKLGDLLCSCLARLLTPVQLALTRAGIQRELEVVEAAHHV